MCHLVIVLACFGQLTTDSASESKLAECLTLARKAYASHDYEACIRHCDSVISRSIDMSQLRQAFSQKAQACSDLSRHADARSTYEQWLRLAPNDSRAHNDFAWYLATCPRDDVRDAALAYKHARTACELTEWKNSFYLDTLAAAYAESGDFVTAVRWQKQTLAGIDPTYREEYSGRLRLYEQNRPYRQGMPLPSTNVVVAPQPSVRVKQPSQADSFVETMKTIQEVAEAVQDVREVLPAVPARGTATIVVKSVSVAADDGGEAWDWSGAPDLKVRVEHTGLFGSSWTSDTRQDVFHANYGDESIRVSEGDSIRVTVLDGDVLDDDTIGSTEVTISKSLIDQGQANWTFDGVTSLVIEFRR